MTDRLDQLRRRYTVLALPEDAKEAFEDRLRRHQETVRSYTLCPACLNSRPAGGDFSACPHCCLHTTTVKGYLRQANGVCKGQLLCLACAKRRDLLRGETDTIYDLCLRDNTLDDAHPCQRCGTTTGTELQHWAPRAIFADADQWPTGWLCPTCHRIWHNAMRAAHGTALPHGQRARANGVAPHRNHIAWGDAS